MALYARSELKLLLVLAGAAVLGLAVREWRAGFPGLAERIERFDEEGQATAGGAAPIRPGPEDDPRPLDLNRATAEQLGRLPGIGAALGRRIAEHRARAGPFDSPEDLRRVPGLGPRKLAAIRELITAGAGQPRVSAEPRPAMGSEGEGEPRGASSGLVPERPADVLAEPSEP